MATGPPAFWQRGGAGQALPSTVQCQMALCTPLGDRNRQYGGKNAGCAFSPLEAIPDEEGNLFVVYLDAATHGFGDKNPVLIVHCDG